MARLGEAPATRSRSSKRVTGLDAARGIALIGMMAIHLLPEATEDFEPTVVWDIASGTSAALFALLAGVGLAISARPGSGANWLKAARVSLAIRASIIAGIGLLLGMMDIPAFIILASYGMMFVLAIPLLGLGARALVFASLGFATLGAISAWLLADSLPSLGEFDPSLSLLLTDPGASLGSLLFSGTYPAIPWMAYICAGMALGKLNLRSLDIQLRLFLTGLGLAGGTTLVSALLLGPLRGKAALIASVRRRVGADGVEEAIIWGFPHGAPSSSGWWQVVLSPYSNTVFELLNTLGVAMAALAVMLYLGNKLGWALRPLCIVGSMTLSIYTMHLLFLATGLLSSVPMLSLWLQVGAGLLFAVLWVNVSGIRRGPLEHVVAMLAGAARDKVLAQATQNAKSD